jgi:hypothetical protein
MLKLKFLLWLIPITTVINCFLPLPPAQANCAGYSGNLEEVNQEVQQRAQRLKQDPNYFWGNTKMYDMITDRQIILAPAFNALTAIEKRQVLDVLQLAGSTYQVYDSDRRLVSAQYDGCTRRMLLTERDRFSWYLNRPPVNRLNPDALRNAGQPAWRTVNYVVTAEQERATRLEFWQAVGYDNYQKGWWIAWVPEGGYFEITVVNADDSERLKPFLQKVSRLYRYVVIASDGTPLFDTQQTHSANPWKQRLGKVSAPPGWEVRPCEGENSFLCASTKGDLLGTVEFQRWSLEQQPFLQQQLAKAGVTGAINYQDPQQKAKVMAALKALVEDHYRTIAQDRRSTYGSAATFSAQPAREVLVGKIPGLQTGFTGIQKTGGVREQYRSYFAFDGSNLYVIATSFDPGAVTTTFKNLANFQIFDPHLMQIVADLKLP